MSIALLETNNSKIYDRFLEKVQGEKFICKYSQASVKKRYQFRF